VREAQRYYIKMALGEKYSNKEANEIKKALTP
jgi:hypothetical protein